MATKQYVQMTTQMVEAAKQSARAAELALNIQRPYVFAQSFRLEDHERRQLDLPLPLLTGTTGGLFVTLLSIKSGFGSNFEAEVMEPPLSKLSVYEPVLFDGPRVSLYGKARRHRGSRYPNV
jgi:hypothetical protein